MSLSLQDTYKYLMDNFVLPRQFELRKRTNNDYYFIQLSILRLYCHLLHKSQYNKYYILHITYLLYCDYFKKI